MSSIYSRASMVLACLGQEDEHTRPAVKVNETIVDFYVNHKDEIHAKRYYCPDPMLLLEAGFDVPTEHQWCQWLTLFSRSWFERAWVVQEAGLAKDVALLFGLQSLRLNNLIFAYNTLVIMHLQCNVLKAFNHRRQLYPEFEHTDEAFTDLISGSWSMSNMLQIWDDVKKDRLESFIYVSRHLFADTRCADPRDKVYATFGLSREFQNPHAIRSLVNYSVDKSEVYARTTKFVIDANHNLAILSLVANRAASDTLDAMPSWCPDFDDRKSGPGMLRLHLTKGGLEWNASVGSRIASTEPTETWGQLAVRGHHIDTIRSVSVIDGSRRHSQLQSLTNMTGMLQIAAEVAKSYVFG